VGECGESEEGGGGEDLGGVGAVGGEVEREGGREGGREGCLSACFPPALLVIN